MNKKVSALLAGVFACASVFSIAGCSGGNGVRDTYTDWHLTSADKSVNVDLKLDDGVLKCSVKKDGTSILEESTLGMKTDLEDFNGGFYYAGVKSNDRKISYEPISGKISKVETEYSEKVVTFVKGNYFFDVTMRAYNDGYAFKYGISSRIESQANEDIEIEDEYTSFALPYNAATYSMSPFNNDVNERFCYEESYARRKADKSNGILMSMPMLYETNDGYWSLITESGLIGSDYRGSYLLGNDKSEFKTVRSYASESVVSTTLPFVSPWRVGIVGGLDTIVESTLVEDVYDDVEYYKPDNYDSLTEEQKKTYDYDWVDTGKCAFTWLQLGSGSQQRWDENKKYIKMAAERGYSWFLIDAGWIPEIPSAHESFRDMMDYAKKLGVKVMAWAHATSDLGDKLDVKKESTIALWKSWGIDGLKIDFFDGLGDTTDEKYFLESQKTLHHYEDLYQITAKYEMVLNIHGTNKPTGERRLYPHVLSREGVRGNEYKETVFARDCVTIPFIRGTVGPSDYTPSLLPFGDNTTVMSQAAMHILYETGILTMADSPHNYKLMGELSEVLDKLPAIYDEIKFMDGAPLDSCSIAKRKGTTWYVAGMTTKAGKMQVDLSKILKGDGNYTAEVYQDGSEQNEFVKRTYTVNRAAVLDIDVPVNGGYVVVIKK